MNPESNNHAGISPRSQTTIRLKKKKTIRITHAKLRIGNVKQSRARTNARLGLTKGYLGSDEVTATPLGRQADGLLGPLGTGSRHGVGVVADGGGRRRVRGVQGLDARGRRRGEGLGGEEEGGGLHGGARRREGRWLFRNYGEQRARGTESGLLEQGLEPDFFGESVTDVLRDAPEPLVPEALMASCNEWPQFSRSGPPIILDTTRLI